MSKYSLSFINGGSEFEIPRMTVELHEEAMDEMIPYGKMDENKYGRLFNKQVIFVVLRKIDKNVKMDDIKNMHPDDYIDLFSKIWDSGKSRKSDKKFREDK